MSNLITIEAPAALQTAPATQAAPAKAALETKAGQNANAAISNLPGDDVILAAQGRLDNVRAIMAALNADPADEDGLMGAKSPDEPISLSNSQIPDLSGILVHTGRSPQALLALLR